MQAHVPGSGLPLFDIPVAPADLVAKLSASIGRDASRAMMAAPTIMPAMTMLAGKTTGVEEPPFDTNHSCPQPRGNQSCTPLGRSMGQGRMSPTLGPYPPPASSVPRLLLGVMPPLVVATTSWAHLVVYAAHEVPLNEGED